MAAAEQPTGADGRDLVLKPGYTVQSVSDKISAIVLTRRTSLGWLLGFGIAFLLAMILLVAITYLFIAGIGIWGVNIPVGWGFAITNFVWWIGIGHAGTLISAILLLLRQKWRTSINRFAEAMTLFAVACAGLFPILHLGRPWLFYWLVPYPNTMALWPQFRSPLVWDFFAISTYATVSLLFWYIGLIPDLATLRDRAQRRISRAIYGILAMGWRNSASHWQRYEVAYLLLAGLATPLVVSVHTIVSFDFTLAIPLRKAYGLEDFITTRHLNAMALILLATGLIVAYSYLIETFMAWYGGNQFEEYVTLNRMFGPYWLVFWGVIFCNVIAIQPLWFKRIRTSAPAMFVIALIVNVGMWLERYMIVVTSLHRDFLPSAWGIYAPTIWDIATFVGSIGLFFALFFLFIRVLPMISIAEMRELVSETSGHREA